MTDRERFDRYVRWGVDEGRPFTEAEIDAGWRIAKHLFLSQRSLIRQLDKAWTALRVLTGAVWRARRKASNAQREARAQATAVNIGTLTLEVKVEGSDKLKDTATLLHVIAAESDRAKAGVEALVAPQADVARLLADNTKLATYCQHLLMLRARLRAGLKTRTREIARLKAIEHAATVLMLRDEEGLGGTLEAWNDLRRALGMDVPS